MQPARWAWVLPSLLLPVGDVCASTGPCYAVNCRVLFLQTEKIGQVIARRVRSKEAINSAKCSQIFAVRALPEAGQKQARKTARSMGLSVW